MTNPEKGKEEAKRRQIESKFVIFDCVIEEYLEEEESGGLFGGAGGGAGAPSSVSIQIQRDENGEQRIVKVKDAINLTAEAIKMIQDMTPEKAKKELHNTRDKFIWFRHQI
jgi:hypothetical protein